MTDPQPDTFAERAGAALRPNIELIPAAEYLKELAADYANEMACESTSTTDVWPDIEAAQKKLYDAIDEVAQSREILLDIIRRLSDTLDDGEGHTSQCSTNFWTKPCDCGKTELLAEVAALLSSDHKGNAE